MMRLARMMCVFSLFPGICAAQIGPGTVPETSGHPTGFASPEMALQALRSRRDVIFKNSGGWLVAEDEANYAVWSFPPQNYPAYPSAIKRYVVKGADGKYHINTAIQCGGTKIVCDQLALDYEQLSPGTFRQ